MHTAAEMMFGLGGAHRYVECGTCGSLGLVDTPQSFDRYYPPGYYSLEPSPAEPPPTRLVGLRRRLVGQFLARPRVASLLSRIGGRNLRSSFRWPALLAGAGLSTDSAVLDVGCGSGHRLRTLRAWGFRRLAGADPFLPAGSHLGDGVRLVPAPLGNPGSRYDLVMFHHSLEHALDPPGLLAAARARLSPGGHVLVRLPLSASFAWRTYGTHWAQLDAPRHTCLFSRQALESVAAESGLRLRGVLYDSDSFQFWASEQYARGITLTDRRSYLVDPAASLFSPEDIRRFERRAGRLNAIGDGDQAVFLLARS